MKKCLLIVLITLAAARLTGQPCSPNPYSLEFNGTSTNVKIQDPLAFDITGEITVEAWINATQWAANSWAGSIVSKDGWSAGEFGYALRAGGTGQLSFLIGGWNPNSTPASWQEAQSPPTAMTTNTWYHVAGTFDGNVVTAYINGVAVGTKNFTGTILTSAGFPMRFGKYCDTVHGTRYWTGMIDEVRVWDRALTASELLANMSMHLDTSITHPGLVGYWRCNESTGTTVHDLSGFNANGTLYAGMPSTSVPFSNTPPSTPGISYSGGQLNCTSTGTLTYQWFLNGNAISGATQAILSPTQYGPYTVQVTNASGCSAISPAFNYNTTGVREKDAGSPLQITPSPASETIDIRTLSGMTGLWVFDMAGREITAIRLHGETHWQMPVSGLKPGIYVVKCTAGNRELRDKIVVH